MKNKILFMGLTTTLLALLASNKAKANATFANNLFQKWKGVRENSSSFQPLLVDFWKAAGLSESKARDWNYKYAWSAAFISYVMIKSGYTDFPVSTTHTCFASKIKANRYPKFELMRIESYAPKVGDILMLNRGGGSLTFDSFKCGDSSHSDIVTKIQNGYAYTVGGNVSNQILERKVKLDRNGKIENNLYFAIIKVK